MSNLSLRRTRRVPDLTPERRKAPSLAYSTVELLRTRAPARWSGARFESAGERINLVASHLRQQHLKKLPVEQKLFEEFEFFANSGPFVDLSSFGFLFKLKVPRRLRTLHATVFLFRQLEASSSKSINTHDMSLTEMVLKLIVSQSKMFLLIQSCRTSADHHMTGRIEAPISTPST